MPITDLRAQLYGKVDDVFGGPITIYPYKAKYLGAPIPDPDREVKTGVGVVQSATAAIANALRAAGSLAFLSRRAEADVLLRVDLKYLGDTKQGDRVYVDELEATYEISYMEEPVLRRVIMHLTGLGK